MPSESSAASALPPQGEQQLHALAKANEVRVARAELKRGLASNRVTFASVVLTPPACAETATLSELLLALPGIGPVRSRRVLSRCKIPESKTLGRLSDRQRSELLRLLKPE
jgi:hypothetical protein